MISEDEYEYDYYEINDDDDYYSETYCECETTVDGKEICRGFYCDDYEEE